eukprot:1329785-Amphidinium_carterae.1
MRSWKMRATGSWTRTVLARMPGAVRSHRQSLLMAPMRTEPGGSVPFPLCRTSNWSSRSGSRRRAPGPGGYWDSPASALDCSLRQHPSPAGDFRHVCCENVWHSDCGCPLSKNPCLFPARHHFGSSGVLLGPGGAAVPLAVVSDTFHGWKAPFQPSKVLATPSHHGHGSTLSSAGAPGGALRG